MRRWWPPIAWAALILFVSSTPASSLPVTNVWDKLEHAGAYFVLGFLTVRALSFAPSVRDALVVVGALALFAAADEWHQALIPGRFPDVADWIADTLGVVMAAGGTTLVRRAREGPVRKPSPE